MMKRTAHGARARLGRELEPDEITAFCADRQAQ